MKEIKWQWAKEDSSTLMDMAGATETITWSRLNNFLVVNSVLMVAWVHLWNTSSRPLLGLLVLSLTGLASGFLWAGLGYRGREFLAQYMKMAAKIEKYHFKEEHKDETATDNCGDVYGPAGFSMYLRDEIGARWSGSRGLIIGIPVFVSVVHAALIGYLLGCFR